MNFHPRSRWCSCLPPLFVYVVFFLGWGEDSKLKIMVNLRIYCQKQWWFLLLLYRSSYCTVSADWRFCFWAELHWSLILAKLQGCLYLCRVRYIRQDDASYMYYSINHLSCTWFPIYVRVSLLSDRDIYSKENQPDKYLAKAGDRERSRCTWSHLYQAGKLHGTWCVDENFVCHCKHVPDCLSFSL